MDISGTNSTAGEAGGDEATGRELVCLTVQAEPLKPRVDVRHDPSYVAQLLANAADLPNAPQRRRVDRAGPLSAYAVADAVTTKNGRTRRIV